VPFVPLRVVSFLLRLPHLLPPPPPCPILQMNENKVSELKRLLLLRLKSIQIRKKLLKLCRHSLHSRKRRRILFRILQGNELEQILPQSQQLYICYAIS
jgi:hypothetical protein